MTDLEGWSDDQIEAVKRWKSKGEDERHPHDLLPSGRQSHNRGVSDEECAEMRRLFKDDESLTIKGISEQHFSYSQTTVAEHVFNRRCTHEIAEEAAESPMGPIDPDEFVTVDECREMRECYWDGVDMEIVTVRDRFGKSYGQTYHHLIGRCECDHDVPDIRHER